MMWPVKDALGWTCKVKYHDAVVEGSVKSVSEQLCRQFGLNPVLVIDVILDNLRGEIEEKYDDLQVLSVN